jgi:hypothetical protein
MIGWVKKKRIFFYIYYIYICTNQEREREVVGEYAKKKERKWDIYKKKKQVY